jgi:glutamate/tyrosine decarboxylase-like PLP-dependent enzyme
MHHFDEQTEALLQQVTGAVRERLSSTQRPLDGPATACELAELTGQTITREGIGGNKALGLFLDVLAPRCMNQGHLRNFSAVPSAPTPSAVIFDLLLSAEAIFAGTWAAGAGAIFAENEVLRWLADEAGFPASAGGTFVQGGTLGVLSALIAAREQARKRNGPFAGRAKIAASVEAHFAVRECAAAMDCEVVPVGVDNAHRMTAATLASALEGAEAEGLFAVVATAGSTNLGAVDDLAGIADICTDRKLYLHVDGTYGFPAILSQSGRGHFAGIERADSLTVDPHKWLFAPYDSCALLYRDRQSATAAHRWSDAYLESQSPLKFDPAAQDPKDFALHLSRRARGLPLWFSLATHGIDAYRQAVETSLAVIRAAAAEVRRRELLELVLEPTLSVLVFRRRGWQLKDYLAVSDRLLAAGTAWFLPTQVDGEPAARIAVVNPNTTLADITLVLDAVC